MDAFPAYRDSRRNSGKMPDPLGVVGGIAQEHRNADEADNAVKDAQPGDEQADHAKNHQKEQAGEQDGTDAGEVPPSQAAIDRQHPRNRGAVARKANTRLARS